MRPVIARQLRTPAPAASTVAMATVDVSALDARMRPLAGMAAHRSDCLVRVVPSYPGRIEALSANPARVVSPDVAEIGRFEGLELDSWESTSRAKMPAAGHVDEGRTRVGEGWHAAGHVRPPVHSIL